MKNVLPLVLATALVPFSGQARERAPNSAVALAETAVRSHLADPANGRFLDAKVTATCDGVSYVTGHITGKNELGGEARPTIFLVRVQGRQATVLQALGTYLGSEEQRRESSICQYGSYTPSPGP